MSGRKVSLADLAGRSTPDLPAPIPAQVPHEPASAPEGVPPEAVEARPQPASRVRDRPTEPVAGEWRPYDQYERKEARLRDDQYNRLSEASRRLNRARKGKGERITENTLIRVAIDLLLERGDQLSGTTEAEIRSALGLRPRHVQSPPLTEFVTPTP